MRRTHSVIEQLHITTRNYLLALIFYARDVTDTISNSEAVLLLLRDALLYRSEKTSCVFFVLKKREEFMHIMFIHSATNIQQAGDETSPNL
jgi:hypothetical protein